MTNTIAILAARLRPAQECSSIAGLFAKAIGYTHSDQSVSALFDWGVIGYSLLAKGEKPRAKSHHL